MNQVKSFCFFKFITNFHITQDPSLRLHSKYVHYPRFSCDWKYRKNEIFSVYDISNNEWLRFGLKSNNASYSRGLNLHWTEVKLELFGWVLSFKTTCIITVKFKGLRFNEKTLRTVGKSFAPLRSFDHCKKAWCVNMFLPFFFIG